MSLLDQITSNSVYLRVDVFYGGTLALCDFTPNKAIFIAAGIDLDVEPDELTEAVKEGLKCECEILDQHPWDRMNIIFSRPLEEPLRDPRSYLLSTQRKFLEICQKLSGRALERRLIQGD